MKWTLLAVLLGMAISNVTGQKYTDKPVYIIESPINIAKDEVNKIFIAPPAQLNRFKSASEPKANFEISYVNFPEDAKQAFEYAISIWENLISSPVPIKILAYWEYMDANILAKSRPSTFYNNFSGSPLSDIYYPVALVEKLTAKEMNPGSPDIICHFNSKYQWYLGTDGNTPKTHYDLVSSVMHEITHGLGFSGFLTDKNNVGFFNNSSNLPSIYDYFVFNYLDQQIADKGLFESPSTELHNQLTSEKLKFSDSEYSNQTTYTVDWLYAPPVWNDGSSIYHLKGYRYGDENSLMTPAACKGEAIHNPGEITMEILSRIGWKSITFDFEQLKDIEKTCAELPVKVNIHSDLDEDLSCVKLMFSDDGFTNADSVYLNFDENFNGYIGKMPIQDQTGTFQYYLKATTVNNRTFKHPADAPQKKFNFRIGPDYLIPDIMHNPVKLVSKNQPTIELSALVTDNIGIESVKIEYKLNGVLQEPVLFSKKNNDLFNATIQIPDHISETESFEYRITAWDKAARSNKRTMPSMGFYQTQIFEQKEPLWGYINDFEKESDDFICSDFSISPLPGFNGKILHTQHPYPVSKLTQEKYNLLAVLKHPIILQENGKMSFNEVVLVEAGISGSSFSDLAFMDYVIVEASKDEGITWLPLTEGYDCANEDIWFSNFLNSFTNNTSNSSGHESMFVKKTINLTENTGFEAGDTVIIRFRLASDQSINGWGWGIDNLKIQEVQTATENMLAENKVTIYPNPFHNNFYVDCANAPGSSSLEITITDLTGKTIMHKTGIDSHYSQKIQIDMSDKGPGLYLVNITDGNKYFSTNKIIKN